ncbi:Predicted hydrolase, HAD superfamily [Burkholderia latens]|uniref:hypothetical protein n=1 Tax=Burkholderia latens TaxID=488446 RepID=UPI0039A70D11
MTGIYKLRTVDVWDTLLRRVAHPDLSKKATVRYLSIREWGSLKPDYRDVLRLYRLRLRIERKLALAARATGGDGEYTLSDVLRNLAEAALTDTSRAEEVGSALVEFEIEHEARHTYPDPGIRAFLEQYPAERTLFLTDFYMPADVIERLLYIHGFGDVIEGGVSSCDVRANKRSGKIFGLVHARYGIRPEHHVHIGDNLHSDVERPGKLGIRTIHYLPSVEHEKRKAREALFPDCRSLHDHIWRETVRETSDAVATLDGDAKAAYELGLASAPLFIGYALFIVETVLREHHDAVYFFTREGEFFVQVFNRFAKNARLDGYACPSGKLLEVSRIATFCASLRAVSVDEMMRLWTMYRTQSLEALAKTLRIDPLRVAPLAERYDLDMTRKIRHPWKSTAVQQLFTDADFQALVTEHRDAYRDAALAYLAGQGLTPDTERACVVDIGWRGTIQDNLAWMMPSVQFTGLYLGLQQFLNAQPPNVSKRAYGPDVNRSYSHARLLDAVTPIEMLANSPSGSVSGYRIESDGNVLVERAVNDDENAVHERFVRHFQAGVLAAARVWERYVSSHAIGSSDLRGDACRVWSDLVTRSSDALARAYTSLSHNEAFGVGGFVDKRVVPSPFDFARAVVDAERRQDVILYLRQTQWSAGLWGREDLWFGHKCVIASALAVGRAYKWGLIAYRTLNGPLRRRHSRRF